MLEIFSEFAVLRPGIEKLRGGVIINIEKIVDILYSLSISYLPEQI
jgi:hypothetical protein